MHTTQRNGFPRRVLLLLGVTVMTCVSAAATFPGAPSFQELMDPALFPNPQQGMEVTSVETGLTSIRIQTTGADILISLSSGAIEFHQRIGHPRPLAVLPLGMPLEGARVTHRGPGLAWMAFDYPRISIRINGDSLFMLHAHEPLTVPVESDLVTSWEASFKNNHLIADEWGALGLYTSLDGIADQYDPYVKTRAVYPLNADAVLWVAVCPPKPYDWERSFRDNVVWHWSNTSGYPDDAALTRWKDAGNIVLLQSEIMLWEDWNLGFVPRLGSGEFARVRKTLHGLGMRFIVYTSPFYFLKGTSLEPAAFKSFEGFTNWPPGKPTGENMGIFLEAIQKLMTEHKPDGLYFDGQYSENPAALYALARSTREIIGETGLLEWHSTHALGSEGCYLPPADAYVDFILRGEGAEKMFKDADYMRFFVSGYNIHNCIGVLCNNGANLPTPELAARVLDANARFHTIAGWLDNPETMRVLRDHYRARLGPDYREQVETGIDARQVVATAKAAVATLNTPPSWTTPVFSRIFSALPEAEALVSPLNTSPFAIVAGALQITALAHTHAFYRFPQHRPLKGLVIKLMQGTDKGMSWGPAALIRWNDGAMLRMGLRSDGLVQADILGQQLLSEGHTANTWTWLRARWGQQRGIIEAGDDGQHYARRWSFEHGGMFNPPPSEILIGKVPYNGLPTDHSEHGVPGACFIAAIEAYGED